VEINDQKIMLNLTKAVKGVETNVWLNVHEESGKEQTGTLFIN